MDYKDLVFTLNAALKVMELLGRFERIQLEYPTKPLVLEAMNDLMVGGKYSKTYILWKSKQNYEDKIYLQGLKK